MISLVRGGGRLPLMALGMGLGIWVFAVSQGMADGGGSADLRTCPMGHTACAVHHGKAGRGAGFQGFGLGYHLGYGYGGAALGVGPEGGYPFYGGPGYPNCDPVLRRSAGITPFPYFGGPGYPSPGWPNYFGGVGPLAPDQPVITIGDDRYDTGYGPFTGAVPHPESLLAPFTTAAAEGGSSSGGRSAAPPAPATNPGGATSGTANVPVAARSLGIDAMPGVDASGVLGMRVSRVYPGSAAEKAGLHVGDVIHSINGYTTTQSGTLVWVLANAAPNNVLEMSVRAASDGQMYPITAKLP